MLEGDLQLYGVERLFNSQQFENLELAESATSRRREIIEFWLYPATIRQCHRRILDALFLSEPSLETPPQSFLRIPAKRP